MDLRKIKKLIELLEDSALSEMEITEGENTIRLSRSAPRRPAAAPPATAEPPAAPPAADPPPGPAPAAGKTVVSPLVGTFYDSPSPDDAPYVKVGSAVQCGDTLCLIEAMKTFNQIDAEIAGVVTVIHKNSGEPVEYGEPLFVIDSGGDRP
ncbi:MAG: acetyl-CoA carboxylase biotin carboxyl carrier protein [Gammaproteobacteria bacterium]|nr:acetyl-CoA carboxylase biotin carboxyl carrier protein [Gammaproteobacteria bacterium]